MLTYFYMYIFLCVFVRVCQGHVEQKSTRLLFLIVILCGEYMCVTPFPNYMPPSPPPLGASLLHTCTNETPHIYKRDTHMYKRNPRISLFLVFLVHTSHTHTCMCSLPLSVYLCGSLLYICGSLLYICGSLLYVCDLCTLPLSFSVSFMNGQIIMKEYGVTSISRLCKIIGLFCRI